MISKFVKGNIFLPLLLLLSISGFFLVKSIVTKTFSQAQNEVEAGIRDRYDLNSYKFSLSRHMDTPNTWKSYVNNDYNFAIKHPNSWLQSEREFPGTLEFFEVTLGRTVALSVAVQDTFVESREAEKLKTKNAKFTFFLQEPTALAAYVKKNELYYIIRLKEDNFFGTEREFKSTFANILKTFEFLD